MEMIDARLLRNPSEVLDPFDGTARARVARHYGACARGVADAVAHERMLAFYRSSGQAWSRGLDA